MGKAHTDANVSADLASNTTVGRYQLLMPLGVGGAATVYLARVSGIGGFAREVAVKVLHPHLRQDKAYVADFIREARLASGLRHPNVLPVLDVGETASSVYLVMDWVDGCSLAELLAEMKSSGAIMPLPVALRIMADALAGLHAAHESLNEHGQSLGLVHRDVSPHNLLLSAAGVTLLADFGIAKPTAQSGHTRTGVIKGKLGYMAPEQLRGLPLDRRTDVWSAGVTCWEMLAGRRPLSGDDEAQLILDVTTGRMPLLQDVRPDLPPTLAQAIQGALATHPDDRWPSADVFRKHLLGAASACGGLAEADEVSAFVMATMGDTIEGRRERAHGHMTAPIEEARPVRRPRRAIWFVPPAAVASVAAILFWGARRESHPRPQPQTIPTATAPAPQAARAPLPPASSARPVQHAAAPGKTRPSPPRSRQVRHKTNPPPLADNPYTRP